MQLQRRQTIGGVQHFVALGAQVTRNDFRQIERIFDEQNFGHNASFKSGSLQ
jgi:hypothetical protein